MQQLMFQDDQQFWFETLRATANLVMKAARRTAKKVRRDSRKAARHYGTKKNRRPRSTRKSTHKIRA